MPYNAFLLTKFDAHINVQVVNTIRSVKYLYKYVYKGHDKAAVDITHDEIKKFLDARYVGAPEACWRLFGFGLHGQSHVVERLPVHLENDQEIIFELSFAISQHHACL